MSDARRPIVVNADDGGLHADTDASILRCAREGVVRSVSVLANGPTTERFVERALDAGLDLGLHVNLTECRAMTGRVAGLTDDAGAFLGTARKAATIEHLFTASPEVADEVHAQWERLRALGVSPSHVDGHNHVHVAPAVSAVLEGLDAPVYVRRPVEPDGSGPRWFPVEVNTGGRCRHVRSFIGHALAPEPTLATLRKSLLACEGSVEWMAHPGRRPGSPFTDSDARDREDELLRSPEVPALFDELGFRLTSFRALLDEEAA